MVLLGELPGDARIARAVFYELVALAETEQVDDRRVLGVWSEGVFFPIDEMPPEFAGQSAGAAAG